MALLGGSFASKKEGDMSSSYKYSKVDVWKGKVWLNGKNLLWCFDLVFQNRAEVEVVTRRS